MTSTPSDTACVDGGDDVGGRWRWRCRRPCSSRPCRRRCGRPGRCRTRCPGVEAVDRTRRRRGRRPPCSRCASRGRRSRAGEWYSAGVVARPARPSSNQRAPITLLLQVTGAGPVGARVADAVELRRDDRGVGARSLSGAKLGLSGQKPVSRSPTMTPLPALLVVAELLVPHALLWPSRPEELGRRRRRWSGCGSSRR